VILGEVAGPWTALTAGIGALMILYLVQVRGRKIDITLGQVKASVEDVSRAVNHRPEGDPTIYELVRIAADEAAEAKEAAAKQAARTDVMADDLARMGTLMEALQRSHELHLAWHQRETERAVRPRTVDQRGG
jgi:hypothetical protein